MASSAILPSAPEARSGQQERAGISPDSDDTLVGPSRPPGLAAGHGRTVEEVLAEMNKSPLFMTTLEENDDVAALRALAYEGTPLENAGDFKERGNECFAEKKFA